MADLVHEAEQIALSEPRDLSLWQTKASGSNDCTASLEATSKLCQSKRSADARSASACDVSNDAIWHGNDRLIELTNEDVLSVVGENVSLLPRELAKAEDSSVNPAGSYSLDAGQPHDVKVPASPVKSIHHFCVLPDGLQLPLPYRVFFHQHHRQMSSEVGDPAVSSSVVADIIELPDCSSSSPSMSTNRLQ